MNELTELEVDEVSLVDAGANPQANILLFKRKGESQMADKDTKNLEQPAPEPPTPENVNKHDEKSAPTPTVEPPTPEIVDKSADLERERAELAKAQETVNALIGKLQEHVDKADTAELTEVAKKYEILGFKTEELVPQLKGLKQFPELYKQLITSLDTSLAAVEKSKMFEEIGKSGHGGTVVTEVEKFATEIQKNNPKLGWREAIDAAYQAHPELKGI